MNSFQFACPNCGTPLEDCGTSSLLCPRDGTLYECRQGIWHLLSPERRAYYDPFMHDYQAVRQAEQRGAPNPEYYRALPFKDLTGRFTQDWRIRARSFMTLIDNVLRPLGTDGRPLRILDLGAGNGWLSNRLADRGRPGGRGHCVAAVDLMINSADGLGAHVQYETRFTPVQADFTCPPFTPGQFDLVIFNASLHYATCYEDTLRAAWSMLAADGRLVILDTPIYHHVTAGLQMVHEREADFQRQYGFPSNAIPSENFLTFDRLNELGTTLAIRWELLRPFYGWRWSLRPWLARLTGHREPAQFMVIVGHKPAASVESEE